MTEVTGCAQAVAGGWEVLVAVAEDGVARVRLRGLRGCGGFVQIYG